MSFWISFLFRFGHYSLPPVTRNIKNANKPKPNVTHSHSQKKNQAVFHSEGVKSFIHATVSQQTVYPQGQYLLISEAFQKHKTTKIITLWACIASCINLDAKSKSTFRPFFVFEVETTTQNWNIFASFITVMRIKQLVLTILWGVVTSTCMWFMRRQHSLYMYVSVVVLSEFTELKIKVQRPNLWPYECEWVDELQHISCSSMRSQLGQNASTFVRFSHHTTILYMCLISMQTNSVVQHLWCTVRWLMVMRTK